MRQRRLGLGPSVWGRKCSNRDSLSLDVPEQCCGLCLPTFVEKGSAGCSSKSTLRARRRPVKSPAETAGTAFRPPWRGGGYQAIWVAEIAETPKILLRQGFPLIGLSLAEIAETPTTSRIGGSCRSSETVETSMGGQDPIVHRRQIRRHEILALRQACDLAGFDVDIEKTGAVLVLGHIPYPGIHLEE